MIELPKAVNDRTLAGYPRHESIDVDQIMARAERPVQRSAFDTGLGIVPVWATWATWAISAVIRQEAVIECLFPRGHGLFVIAFSVAATRSRIRRTVNIKKASAKSAPKANK